LLHTPSGGQICAGHGLASKSKQFEMVSSASERAGGTADDVGDAFQAVTISTAFINNADAKAGLSAAAVTAVVAVLSQQTATIGTVLSGHTTADRWSLLDFILLALSLAMSCYGIGHALIPRHASGNGGGRFSFPDVAQRGWRFTPASRSGAALEAWAQAQTLAQIAKRKFIGVRIAIIALGVTFVTFMLWIGLTSRL
jgi:hypothetical protein